MKKYDKKNLISIKKILEYIGKPIFFIFKTITISWFILYTIILNFISRPIKQNKKKVKIRKKHSNSYHFPFKALYLMLPITFGYIFYTTILADLPQVTSLTSAPPTLTTKIYDRHGELLFEIYKNENRSLIKLNELPHHLIEATLSAEDKNFYNHYGVDIAGITRATINNVKCYFLNSTCSLQGGSTITQQLVKNTLLTPEKTYIRKTKELILSFMVEHAYSKDQILEMYLNQVGYGGTAYGIEQASQQYFGKESKFLSLSESAMLAGLPISPTLLSPFGTNPYLSKIRQQQVLESMVKSGKISEDQKVNALSTPLVFNPQGITIRAPHFVMYVKDLLVKEYGENTVSRGGLEVVTTLDLSMQNLLQEEIKKELDKLQKLHVQNGAGLITRPKTGEILAMVGSHDFFDNEGDGQVNLVLQERQPGSSIKPITYALAFSNGASPASISEDTPICFVIKGQDDYCPKNYDGKFHGRVPLRTALASSYNIPAVKLLNKYGVSNMITLAQKMGITTWNDSSRFGLSLTLGGGEVTMLDMASVYSVFANNGTKIPINPILSVKDHFGQLLSTKSPTQYPAEQIISPSVAFQINSILSDPIARAPAFGNNSILNLPGKNVAVKTGTTNSMRDNWTFGYTPDILVATWVGNNDNSPMSSIASGITGASPIWAHTMHNLVQSHPVSEWVTPNSLVKVNTSCTTPPRYEYFVKGSEPKINCAQKIGTLLESAAATSQ